MMLHIALLLAVTLASVGASAPTRHRVAIAQFKYAPRAIHVAVGDTIVWDNRDIVPHTATADDEKFDSGDIPARAQRTTVMRTKGEYTYTCLYHSNMKGKVVVR